MITTSKATKLDGTVVTEYRGLHNDMKPVTGLTTGDIFYELDGDYIFRWDGTQWVQLVANDSEGGSSGTPVIEIPGSDTETDSFGNILFELSYDQVELIKSSALFILRIIDDEEGSYYDSHIHVGELPGSETGPTIADYTEVSGFKFASYMNESGGASGFYMLSFVPFQVTKTGDVYSAILCSGQPVSHTFSTIDYPYFNVDGRTSSEICELSVYEVLYMYEAGITQAMLSIGSSGLIIKSGTSSGIRVIYFDPETGECRVIVSGSTTSGWSVVTS